MKDQNPQNMTQKEPKSDPNVNEIDDFTQKLLDKQAELALFPDDDEITSSSLVDTMNEAQRRNAEASMLKALDQFRKERGQDTIEEEERKFALRHPNKVSKTKSSSAGHSKSPHNNHSETNQAKEHYEEIEPNRYETKNRENHFEKTETRPANKVKFYYKPRFWVVAAIVAVIAAVFGAYAWKVTVYDPMHATDVEQNYAYNKLINFADEYPMKSDAQKRDVLNLESDYNSLPEAKKDEINQYFANPKHTGKTFVELLNEMKQTVANEENPALQALLDYARGWQTADEATRQDIVNRIEAFNTLSDSAKNEVNSVFVPITGKDFTTVYNEFKAAQDQAAQASQQQADAAQTAQQQADNKAELQAQLAQLQADREAYSEFLASEGLEPDEILAQYDADIAQIRAQLNQ
ncbi:hypothetical protein IM774_04890 [Erysipelotrichaceae bacterium RD49]|nr:hypothetical protein [Erysipelotrichaceae bacterium RD49]